MHTGQAGSLESGDLLVLIRPRQSDDQVEIHIESPVKALFGRRIAEVVREALADTGVSGVDVFIKDRGALDYAIRARVKTAAARYLASLQGGD